MKTMKDKFVYVINTDELPASQTIGFAHVSDMEWIRESKRQKNVFALDAFEMLFNSSDSLSEQCLIRIR